MCSCVRRSIANPVNLKKKNLLGGYTHMKSWS